MGNVIVSTSWGICKQKEKRLRKIYCEIESMVMDDLNVQITDGKIFNSGYEGLTFEVRGIKIIIIEQPGVMGLEDQKEGYLELRVDGRVEYKMAHESRRYGDTNLTAEELDEGYRDIIDVIYEGLGCY